MVIDYKIIADGKIQPGHLTWKTSLWKPEDIALSFYMYFERKTNYLDRSIYIKRINTNQREVKRNLHIFFGERLAR